MPTISASRGLSDTLYAPQAPGLVAAFDPRLLATTLAVFSINEARGTRVVVPRTGTLSDIAVYVGVSSGNIDVGVYDTTATTRNKLYSSGSTACPAANGWRIVATAALAVTAGDEIDLALSADNATASFGRYVSAGSGVATLPAGFWPTPLGTSKQLQWTIASQFPLPTTLTEASLGNGQTTTAIIARIS